jgi:uncharacterized protein (TIGR04255 family)
VTETRKALGRWPNAPLALVIAQVNFEPAPETTPSTLAERIKLATGDQFPYAIPLQQISFVIGQGDTPPPILQPAHIGLDLRNARNDEVLRLRPDTLSFATSAYQDSIHFAEQWKGFMEALCEDRAIRVVRLGVRYVDFIIPSPGHTPEDYFRDGLGRSPAAFGKQSPVVFSLYGFERPDGGQLRVGYSRGFGAPALPPDVQDLVLPPPGLTTKSNSDISAVLDMDRWRMVNVAMNADEVAAAVGGLRADMASAFRSIMTELASNEWQKKDALEAINAEH